MKISKIVLNIMFLVAVTASAAYAQQSFIHTVTRANTKCNTACSLLDVPELAGNPNAVIFITPVDGSTYRHQIGANYRAYEKQWSVFNMDNDSMTEGTRFKVEYYANADEQHFTYVAGQQVAHFGVGYIDHTGLDNNPVATVRFTAHISSLTNGNYNRLEAKVVYDPNIRKWIVANVNGQALTPGVAYNIGFNPGASATNPNTNNTIGTPPQTTVPPTGSGGSTGSCNCVIPTSLPPSGEARGDLTGTYPNPQVKGILGRPISITAPQVGQSYKWSGTAWEPTYSTNPPQPVQSLQTYFKTGAMAAAPLTGAPGAPNIIVFSDLSQHIVITKRSRFVIAATIKISNTDSAIGFNNNKFRLEVFINGVSKMFVVSSLEAGAFNTSTVGPFMIDEDAGTYDIVFKAEKVSGALTSFNCAVQSNQSSVIVISLDTTNTVL